MRTSRRGGRVPVIVAGLLGVAFVVGAPLAAAQHDAERIEEIIPQPGDPNGPSFQRVRQRWYDLERAETIGRWKDDASLSEELRREATEIAEWWIRSEQGTRVFTSDEFVPMAERAQQCLRAGLADASFRLITGQLQVFAGDRYGAGRQLNSLNRVDRAHTTPFVRMALAREMSDWGERESQRRQAMLDTVDALVDFCAANRPDVLTERALFEYMVKPLLERQKYPTAAMGEMADRLDEAAAKGIITPWMGMMVRGTMHYEQGWIAHDESRNHQIGEKIAEFRAEMETAEHLLVRADEQFPDRPEAAGLLIQTLYALMNEDPSGPRRWFERAVSIEFDYPTAYIRYGWTLVYQFGPNMEPLILFARRCAATNRYDTMVPWQLTSTLERAADNLGPDVFRVLKSDPDLWPDLREMLETYLKQERTPVTPRWAHARLAFYAWLMGEFEFARQHATQTTSTQLRSMLALGEYDENRFMSDLTVMTQDYKAAAFLLAAEGAIKLGQYAQAAEQFQRALDALEPGDGTRRRVEVDLFRAKMMAGAGTPDGAALQLPAVGIVGWMATGTNWIGEGDAIVAEKSRDDAYLLCAAPFGERIELTGRIVVNAESAFAQPAAAIVLLGAPPAKPDDPPTGIVVHLAAGSRPSVSIGRYPNGGDSKKTITPSKEGYAFRVRLFDGTLSIEVNGERIFTGSRPALSRSEPGANIGFCVPRSRNPAEVRFEHFVVRLLEERPSDF